jgi:hypothetical protein
LGCSLKSFALLIGYFILAGSQIEASGLYGITILDPGTTHGLLLDSTLNNQVRVADELSNYPGD